MQKVLGRESTQDELKEAFQAYDKGGKGFISAAELRHVLTSVGEAFTAQEVDDMIREADTAGTGQINYEQFISQVLQ